MLDLNLLLSFLPFQFVTLARSLRLPKPLLLTSSILKYVIVGDASVGKSCLLVRLTDDRFGTSEPTLGVEFAARIIDVGEQGKRVKVQCECLLPTATVGHQHQLVAMGHEYGQC